MKYIALIIVVLGLSIAWQKPECKHVYTAVESEVFNPDIISILEPVKELICVRCFYRTTQKRRQVSNLQWRKIPDSSLQSFLRQ